MKDNSLKLSIHKYVGCGNDLFLSCCELGISTKNLETENFNEAVSKSKEIVSERVKHLREEAYRFCMDTHVEIVRY